MEELINEAEGMYLELSRITDSLVYARLHDDNVLLHGCRNELENYAQSVMQTLKCLVDRKDNIVDLSEVWHEISEPFRKSDMIIYGNNRMQYMHFADEGECLNDERNRNCKYAYIDDLLPKGGE